MLTPLLTVWLLYLAAMVSPDPNVLLVSQIATSDMARNARFAGFGVAAGAGIWASCAVLGVDALFLALPILRTGLPILGGAYLLYLASRLWRSNSTPIGQVPMSVSRFQAFRLELLTNIANECRCLLAIPTVGQATDQAAGELRPEAT
jgi:threonine efflux protein